MELNYIFFICNQVLRINKFKICIKFSYGSLHLKFNITLYGKDQIRLEMLRNSRQLQLLIMRGLAINSDDRISQKQ